MNRRVGIAALFCLVGPFVVCQTLPKVPDCTSLRYSEHKVSCLCGAVDICTGDLCGAPKDYNLDDDITVELRDRVGTAVLDSKKVTPEKLKRDCTTSTGIKVSCDTMERRFCFKGKANGHYQLAFVLFKNGVSQPAVKFPTKYQRKTEEVCDAVYMVEPSCPK